MVVVELLYRKGDDETNHDNNDDDDDHDNDDDDNNIGDNDDDDDDDFAQLRFVVTAAHCIEGDAYGWEVSIKNANDQLLMTKCFDLIVLLLLVAITVYF